MYWVEMGVMPQVLQEALSGVDLTYSSLPHMEVLYWGRLRATLMGTALPGCMLLTYEPAGGQTPGAPHGPPTVPAHEPAQPLLP